MSIESAKLFYLKVSTDEKFRNQLEQVSTEERSLILQEAGYGFTIEEWETAKEQILSASDSDERELSDAELTEVSGGFIPAYGVVSPFFPGGLGPIDWDDLLFKK